MNSLLHTSDMTYCQMAASLWAGRRTAGLGERARTLLACPGKCSHLVTRLIPQSGTLPFFFPVGFLLPWPGVKEGSNPGRWVDLEQCKQNQNHINCNYIGSQLTKSQVNTVLQHSDESPLKYISLFFFTQMMCSEERCPLFYLLIVSTTSV